MKLYHSSSQNCNQQIYVGCTGQGIERSIHECMTRNALLRGLFLQAPRRPLVVINGAGIAGLAAAIALRALGANVVVLEKRDRFSRHNILNFDVAIQQFLERYGLLGKFREKVGSRITEHKLVLFKRDGSTQPLDHSDVRNVESAPVTAETIDQLFMENGVFSGRIMDVQECLAQAAMERGVHIFGNTSATIVKHRVSGGVSEIEFAHHKNVQPDLFAVAEGAHSTTRSVFADFETKILESPCNGEIWIFGNLPCKGLEETHVISAIDASGGHLVIMNGIYNKEAEELNFAVGGLPNEQMNREEIRATLLLNALKVNEQQTYPCKCVVTPTLLSYVSQPVVVQSVVSSTPSVDNVLLLGDAVGRSSPLAGFGGTQAFCQALLLAEMLQKHHFGFGPTAGTLSPQFHAQYAQVAQDLSMAWIQKSSRVKEFCLKTFAAERVG